MTKEGKPEAQTTAAEISAEEIKVVRNYSRGDVVGSSKMWSTQGSKGVFAAATSARIERVYCLKKNCLDFKGCIESSRQNPRQQAIQGKRVQAGKPVLTAGSNLFTCMLACIAPNSTKELYG